MVKKSLFSCKVTGQSDKGAFDITMKKDPKKPKDLFNQMESDVSELQAKLAKELRHNSWLSIALIVLFLFMIVFEVGVLNQEPAVDPTKGSTNIIYTEEFQELKKQVEAQKQAIDRLQEDIDELKETKE